MKGLIGQHVCLDVSYVPNSWAKSLQSLDGDGVCKSCKVVLCGSYLLRNSRRITTYQSMFDF